MVSTSQSCPYYSPKSDSYTVPVADLMALRFAKRRNDWDILENTWMGEVASYTNNLALAYKDPAADRLEWFVALHHFDKSPA